jgi:hypothetical protein
MRPLVLGVVLASGVAAAAPPFAPPPKPGPPVRKPASQTFTADALSEFAEAIIADKHGDLEQAENHYRRAADAGDQPACHYNLADVRRRMERTKDAIEEYKKYLELLPDAPDRSDVEKLVEQLQATPPILTIDGDDPRAVVFVDGIYVGPSPQSIQITEGKHAVDRIGPTSYQHETVTLKALDHRHVEINSRPEEPGNVVLSSSVGMYRSGGWRDEQREWRMHARFPLDPGRYQTQPFGPKFLCNPLAFEVTKGDGVLFVYIDSPEQKDSDRGGCMADTVKTKKVVFPP